LSTNAFCVGSSLTVPTNQTGSFDVSNAFQAYLSDANGSFLNPILIGTSANPNSIACTVPTYLPSSEDYKVMIRSSSPVVLSLGSTANLSITSPSVNLTSPLNDILNLTKTEKASQTLNATNKISGSSIVIFKSGNYVQLNPRFTAEAGTVFEAKVEDICL
jgi:hypothetical protein